MNRVLIIVPAYNEEKNIVAVLERVREAAGFADVLVVNDCSRDGTAQAIKGLRVRVVSLPVNLGIGGAVQTGFKYAKQYGYDIAIQVDGDGQHDPSQISQLIEPIESGQADVVIGSRYLEDRGYRAPVVRRIGMILFSWITSFICRQKITDTTSGFRAVNKEVINLFAREYPADFPDSISLVLLHRSGLRIREIPVNMYQRKKGTSSTGLLKSTFYPYRSLLGILAAWLRKRE